MTESRPPARRSLLRRPWVPECIGFFAVLWQEAVRLELRTAHRVLPFSPRVTAAYYYQFGDFANGYVNAFLIDGITELARRWLSPDALRSPRSRQRQAVVASLLSALGIIGIELIPSALNSPDVRDIPAGVLGAVLYLAIRVAALKRQ